MLRTCGVHTCVHGRHSNMTDSYIYHLVQEDKWKEAGGEGYLPPTYAADGFIHATKEAQLLLPVANHFYTG